MRMKTKTTKNRFLNKLLILNILVKVENSGSTIKLFI